MVTEHMITELTQTVSNLKRDVDVLKEDNSYLYKKLEKAYGDRIELRAENHKLKSKINGNTAEEEECIACSA
jgi:FtsZ-binding cell division protein ZapB